MDSTKYKNEYKKKNYIRKEIVFRKDDWIEIEKILSNHNTTLKNIIYDYIGKLIMEKGNNNEKENKI